jgi:hypothetical protein
LKEESIIEDASCPINLFLNLIQVINVSARWSLLVSQIISKLSNLKTVILINLFIEEVRSHCNYIRHSILLHYLLNLVDTWQHIQHDKAPIHKLFIQVKYKVDTKICKLQYNTKLRVERVLPLAFLIKRNTISYCDCLIYCNRVAIVFPRLFLCILPLKALIVVQTN